MIEEEPEEATDGKEEDEEEPKEAEDDNEEECQEGYISWLGVHPTYRKLGIAAKLMTAAENAMVQEYGCEYVDLKVRVSNHAGVILYTKILGYRFHRNDVSDDGEDAYVMRKQLPGKQLDHLMLGFRHACDLLCFPDVQDDQATNFSFFNESILSDIIYVAEYDGRIVGYVVANMLEEKPEEAKDDKVEDKEECRGGYISWLGVHPTHRKLGIAAKLMTAAEKAMVQVYGCEYVYLHVRVSNHAGVSLYTKILGYRFHYTEAKSFKDGEDAYVMRKQLPGKQLDHLMLGFRHGSGCFWSEAKAELLGLLDRLEIC
ncbi:hypothetical protein MKW94_010884 [Papaver nudicaule]|uniref:N-acetyltransferase domain-containing protein n=1 Tax=Papaver nudicaule TaxID=74823 RepID=A0AA41S571_PAPNU|nr:hypothetical protein [Papaver nudicaule]